MRLVRRSALLTLLTGMRLLVSNAAADATAFKVINVDPSAQMSDLFVVAAKKLLRNKAYELNGAERAFLIMNNGSTRAEVDELDELKEEDHVAVCFDGSDCPAPVAPQLPPPAEQPNCVAMRDA